HSSFSDGKLAIPEIVDLYGSKGFGAIAITDHLCETNTLFGKAAVYMNRTLTPAVFPIYMEILKSEAKRAMKKYGMVVLPGFELTKSPELNHRSARLLGLGVSQFLSANADIVQLCRDIRAQGGVAIATETLWAQRAEIAGEVDAWEAAAGRKLSEEILESGLPKVASSGLHSSKHLSSWKTAFFCEKNPQAILKAIRDQELRLFFYDEEKANDLRKVVDVSRLGVRIGTDLIRNGAISGSFPLETQNLQVSQRASVSRFDSEAFERRGQRLKRKSGEFLSVSVPRV
ncbi:MAG: hypothetical protein HY074_04410, partial [Deltaproteobacteria bacterium]|nr:hypothetical protein [Deltaproteobacteria bacterium]